MASRTFFAIDSPGAERYRLEPLAERLAQMGARPSSLDNLHVTALFLGENVDKGTLSAAKDIISKIRFRQFECSISGLGVFTDDEPRVVFANISSGSRELSELNSMLRNSLSKAGIGTQARYHPHLTLARVRKGTDIEGVMAMVRSSKEPEFSFTCRELKLKQSHDTKDGMAYEDLASIPLV
ncbi:MAG: RNA 2',3'-cyclic phosphodiesterase [Candidatus Micrarchaeota archaeon]|nr:RNA 2',3'-cyclic phosphodiesterase [Candidatus Micrarchaeota archaeon]